MKKQVLSILALGVAAVVFTGCVSTVDGHVRGGVPFRKDRIVSKYERPVGALFDASKAVITANGTLQAENRVNNSLVGKVDTRTVYIKIDEDQPTVSKITVQVRTSAGGVDIDMASELDKQIALKLAK
jgi:hypothetical protein